VGGRSNEAEQEFRKAFALNPNHALAHHWYSTFLEHKGRLDEALAAARSVVANSDLERRWKNDAEAIHVLRQTGHEAGADAFGSAVDSFWSPVWDPWRENPDFSSCW
jgi:Tfp pilus assembly protein PilF